ncbi:MAG: hypothetical protein IIZ78_10390 [Clostridiales bacterium]|nr:hypothetical protein [Clostridiales bacterium]
MHYYGDDWFNEHGDDLYDAIAILDKRLRKAGVIVYCKEKYGTMRTDFFRLWDGNLSDILFGRKLYRDNWFEDVVWWLDYRMIPVGKTSFGWQYVGLSDFNTLIHLKHLVWKWQAKMVNKAFQVTCKEHPDIVDELVCDVDCWKMIKPCKWGDVDGEEIHYRYWRKM